MKVETSYPRECTEEAFGDWLRTKHETVIDDFILPRLNRFLLYLKYSVQSDGVPLSWVTGIVRQVGTIDIVASRIEHAGQVLSTYGISSTVLAAGRGIAGLSNGWSPAHDRMTGAVPKEWEVIVRAVDLVNRGYFAEAFVVAFSLLDDKVQEFLRLRGFSNRDLRATEGDRLRVFIRDLTKTIVGLSPLDDPSVDDEFAWLNRKRNIIMHAGESCTRGEAERGLDVVLKLLRFYAENGAGYALPNELGFYRRPIAVPVK